MAHSFPAYSPQSDQKSVCATGVTTADIREMKAYLFAMVKNGFPMYTVRVNLFLVSRVRCKRTEK